MDETGHGVGWHIRAWAVAFERAGWLIIAMPLTWLLYPVLVVTTMHWEDGAGLPYYLRGELIPRFFSNATLNRTCLTIVAIWLLLLLVTFVFTIMFNRRVQLPLALWPMCFLIVAFVCNFIWFFEKGFWDTPGAIAGTAPVVVLAIFQKVCDRIGAGFVYGGSLEI